MLERSLNVIATVCAVIAVVPIVERTWRSWSEHQAATAEARQDRDRRWLETREAEFQRAAEKMHREVRVVLGGQQPRR